MKLHRQPIFTLNARDNVMLEVTRNHLKLSTDVMHSEIQGAHIATQRVLMGKGVQYAKLKAALVPAADRNEAGFIFDSRLLESSAYGMEVAKAILPLLDRRTTQSVLCGDLIGNNQDLIFSLLQRFLVSRRALQFIHGTLLYCVYINNLSDSALQRLHEGLSAFSPYLGYLPGTFQTPGKTYLSTILVNKFLKCRDVVIMGHEDDRPNEENVNMAGWPFEEYGYRVCSLQEMYFALFLSYKIERAVYAGFEVDTEMSLNAISGCIVRLEDCTIQLDDAKHEYLMREKLGKLQKAGLEDLDRDQLAALIREKVAASYIYNLVFLDEYNVTKFDLMLEADRHDGGYPTRLVAALEYKPDEKTLRVITLY